MDFSHFRMLGFGWESGFGWELWIVEEVLDFVDAFWFGWELVFAGEFCRFSFA